MEILIQEKNILKDIWRRIKKRDFSGNTGIAIKNSVYNFSKTLSEKLGSLIFTIILARLLMPELFGLYSLALSTILIFVSMSQLGINRAIVRFVSHSLGKNKKERAKEYIKHFGKIELILIFISIVLLLIFSRSISETYYQKPIFLALLAGAVYILFIRIPTFFSSILNAFNNFKNTFLQEIIFQLSRIVLVPLAVIYTLKLSLSNEITLFWIILLIAVSYLISGIYSFFVSRRKIFSQFKNTGKQRKLSKQDRKEANHFIFLSAAIVLSGVFFGNIDKIILGGFVSGEFIGYYQAAFSLIGVLTSLSAFGAVLLPIFSRMEGDALKKAMKKTLKLVFLMSIGIFILTLVFSNLIILIIYGKEYVLATNILRLFSVLIFILPITSLYITYFMSQNKPNIVSKSLVLSTLLNILLNYILITSLLRYGEISAVYGATIATIISQGVYLAMLVFQKK